MAEPGDAEVFEWLIKNHFEHFNIARVVEYVGLHPRRVHRTNLINQNASKAMENGCKVFSLWVQPEITQTFGLYALMRLGISSFIFFKVTPFIIFLKTNFKPFNI